uniref:ZZ-type zinc finger-containing protein 3 n=1 Tax=Cacopsylla melanoneura TaxID=428564 RepID=A0A8D9A014_9HEMI
MEMSHSSKDFQQDLSKLPSCSNDYDYGPIEPEPDTTFYFESDHLALKGNVDYLKLIKHIAMLEVQQKLVIQDLEFYFDLEKQVTESSKPSEIATRIANRELKVPPKRKIPKRPIIDWTKYNIQPGIQGEDPGALKPVPFGSKPNTLIPTQTKDVTKPETFKKAWTAEEQIRLEELLLKYPPEKSDSARFRKIAQELGNRTLKQVCSRVQKYYKKMRNLGQKSVIFAQRQKPKKYAKIVHKQNKMLVRESTFLPALSLQSDNKLFMDLSTSEEEEGGGEGEKEEEAGNEGTRIIENKYTLEQWVRILERVKEDKKNETEMKSVIHHELKCHVCKEEPIRGTRWHCLSCSCEDTSVNMCNDCTVLQLNQQNSSVKSETHPPLTLPHPLHHLLHPYPVRNFHIVTSDGQPLDLNYLPSSAFGSNSYLDPNTRTEY